MTRRIYMTGVMSSGKTTIGSELARQLIGSFHKEQINETLLLNTFQNESPKGELALLTQLDFLLQLMNAHNYKLLNQTQVIDTSFLTNALFTDIVVPEKYWDTYKEILSTTMDICEGDNDYNVIIKVPYDVMIDRIKSRNRGYEQTDTFDYEDYYNRFDESISKYIENNKDNPRLIVVTNDGSNGVSHIVTEIKDKILEIESNEQLV